MVTKVENKNWFRRHWIISIFLGLVVLGMINRFLSNDDSNITGNVINEQTLNLLQEEVSACISEWKCSEWTSCLNSKQERVCVDKNDCEPPQNKPTENQTCTEVKKEIKTETSPDTSSSDDWLGDLEDSLKNLNKGLEEQSRINKKVDECTKLCAGGDIGVPYVKNVCRSDCYQVYYYAGEEALDDLIKSYGG